MAIEFKMKKLAIKLLPWPNANLYIPVKMLYLTMIKKAYKEKFHYNYATFVKSILIGCKMLKIESDWLEIMHSDIYAGNLFLPLSLD